MKLRSHLAIYLSVFAITVTGCIGMDQRDNIYTQLEVAETTLLDLSLVYEDDPQLVETILDIVYILDIVQEGRDTGLIFQAKTLLDGIIADNSNEDIRLAAVLVKSALTQWELTRETVD